MVTKLLVVIYLAIGVVVAAANDYFQHLGGLKPIISAVLAVILWPLVLFGVNVRISKLDQNGSGMIRMLLRR